MVKKKPFTPPPSMAYYPAFLDFFMLFVIESTLLSPPPSSYPEDFLFSSRFDGFS